MLIPGFATLEGTERYHERFKARLPGHFRRSNNLWVSSIGLGTYLGEPTATYDQLYTDAVTRAAQSGINIFDSAINYRHQRSERSIGKALAAMFFRRDAPARRSDSRHQRRLPHFRWRRALRSRGLL